MFTAQDLQPWGALPGGIPPWRLPDDFGGVNQESSADLNAEEMLWFALRLLNEADARVGGGASLQPPSSLDPPPEEDPSAPAFVIAKTLWELGVRGVDIAARIVPSREMLWKLRLAFSLSRFDEDEEEDEGTSIDVAFESVKRWVLKIRGAQPPLQSRVQRLGAVSLILRLNLTLMGLLERCAQSEIQLAAILWLHLRRPLPIARLKQRVGAMLAARASTMETDSQHLERHLLDVSATLGAPEAYTLCAYAQLALARNEVEEALDILERLLKNSRASKETVRLTLSLIDALVEGELLNPALQCLLDHIEMLPTPLLLRAIELGRVSQRSASVLFALVEHEKTPPPEDPNNLPRALAAAEKTLLQSSLEDRVMLSLACFEPVLALKILRAEDPDATRSTLRGAVHADLEQWPPTLAAYQRATEEHPDEPHLWMRFGQALAQAGKTQLALQHQEHAFVLGHPHLEDAFEIAKLQLEEGRLSEAEHWLQIFEEADRPSHKADALRWSLGHAALLNAWRSLEELHHEAARGYLTLAERNLSGEQVEETLALTHASLLCISGEQPAAEALLWELLIAPNNAARGRRWRRWFASSAISKHQQNTSPSPLLRWREILSTLASDLPGAHPNDEPWAYALAATIHLSEGEVDEAIALAQQGVHSARMELAHLADDPSPKGKIAAKWLRDDLGALLAIVSLAAISYQDLTTAAHTLIQGLTLAGPTMEICQAIGVLGVRMGEEHFLPWLKALSEHLPEKSSARLHERLIHPDPLSFMEDTLNTPPPQIPHLSKALLGLSLELPHPWIQTLTQWIDHLQRHLLNGNICPQEVVATLSARMLNPPPEVIFIPGKYMVAPPKGSAITAGGGPSIPQEMSWEVNPINFASDGIRRFKKRRNKR